MTETLTPEAAFAAALAAFQAALPHVGKGSKATVPTKAGGSFSYGYAALPDILDATLPALSEQGLAYTASPVIGEHGFVLRFALIHTGGHREEGAYPLPDPARSTPQQIGSAITYGRRYCFCAVTGIAPDEDDDGQHAADSRAADPLPRAPRRAGATTRATAEQMGDPTERDDAWTTPPLRITDTVWLEDIRRRLVACTKPSEVRGLDAEAKVVWAENRLSDEDARAWKVEADQRLQELSGEVVPA